MVNFLYFELVKEADNPNFNRRKLLVLRVTLYRTLTTGKKTTNCILSVLQIHMLLLMTPQHSFADCFSCQNTCIALKFS